MNKELRKISYPTIEQLKNIFAQYGTDLSCLHRVVSPGGAKMIAYIFQAIFVLSIFALIFVPWVQTSFANGKVIAYQPNDRQQNVEAPVEGRISKWHVLEGHVVKAGDPIADISDIDPNIVQRLRAELKAAEDRLEAAKLAKKTSKKNVSRQKALFNKGLSSQRAFEMAVLETARLEAEVSSAQQELQKIKVRVARQDSQTVTSPRDGIIMRIIATQGTAYVKAGTVLATLVPDTKDRAVELFVDGNDLPLMQIGREVRLQFEGWPAIQFSGWPSVAKGTFGGTIGVIDASDDGTGRFRIIVFPISQGEYPEDKNGWPNSKILRQGVRAHGWVLMDTVSIGYELWRKFNGFPISLQSNKPKSGV
jgi:multidrug efflux pump subunit AcrA (membrane-fusion protein)